MNRKHFIQRDKIPDETDRIAGCIINAAFQVHSNLGPGLLENVYETCLVYELTRRKISVRRQVELPITYGHLKLDAGLRLDLLINECVIVELKSVESILPVHKAQILTYLKLTGHRLGLLINFNVPLIKKGIKRIVL